MTRRRAESVCPRSVGDWLLPWHALLLRGWDRHLRGNVRQTFESNLLPKPGIAAVPQLYWILPAAHRCQADGAGQDASWFCQEALQRARRSRQRHRRLARRLRRACWTSPRRMALWTSACAPTSCLRPASPAGPRSPPPSSRPTNGRCASASVRLRRWPPSPQGASLQRAEHNSRASNIR